jgi:hypothetical protein
MAMALLFTVLDRWGRSSTLSSGVVHPRYHPASRLWQGLLEEIETKTVVVPGIFG